MGIDFSESSMPSQMGATGVWHLRQPATAEAEPAIVSDWQSLPGAGLSAVVDDTRVQVGRASWLAETGVILPPDLVAAAESAAAQGHSVTWISADHQAVGLVTFNADLRDDAAATIAALTAKGIRVSLLSGDQQAAVTAMAERIGCRDARGEVPPDGKLQAMAELRGPGRTVGMVGDGINDGPALAAADVGIAIGQGSGLAIESAPVVLLGHRLAPLADVLALAGKTYRIIRQNLAISVLYNVVAIPLAMAGYVTPAVAAVLMPVSSLLVLANAARLTRGNGPWKSSA